MTVDHDSAPLLQRIRGGDNGAVEELIERHLPGLRGFLQQRAGQLLRGKEGVSDLAQSTCREVLQDLGDAQWEGEQHFKRWLYQAALRKLADRGRYWNAARREAGREAAGAAAPDESLASRMAAAFADELGTPSRAAEQGEELRRIEAALRRLSKEHREIILMARFLELPHADIAARIGKNEGATRALLHRALGALRRELGASSAPPPDSP